MPGTVFLYLLLYLASHARVSALCLNITFSGGFPLVSPNGPLLYTLMVPLSLHIAKPNRKSTLTCETISLVTIRPFE